MTKRFYDIVYSHSSRLCTYNTYMHTYIHITFEAHISFSRSSRRTLLLNARSSSIYLNIETLARSIDGSTTIDSLFFFVACFSLFSFFLISFSFLLIHLLIYFLFCSVPVFHVIPSTWYLWTTMILLSILYCVSY